MALPPQEGALLSVPPDTRHLAFGKIYKAVIILHNLRVSTRDYILRSVTAGDTSILHFAFCILRSAFRRPAAPYPFKKSLSIPLKNFGAFITLIFIPVTSSAKILLLHFMSLSLQR